MAEPAIPVLVQIKEACQGLLRNTEKTSFGMGGNKSRQQDAFVKEAKELTTAVKELKDKMEEMSKKEEKGERGASKKELGGLYKQFPWLKPKPKGGGAENKYEGERGATGGELKNLYKVAPHLKPKRARPTDFMKEVQFTQGMKGPPVRRPGGSAVNSTDMSPAGLDAGGSGIKGTNKMAGNVPGMKGQGAAEAIKTTVAGLKTYLGSVGQSDVRGGFGQMAAGWGQMASAIPGIGPVLQGLAKVGEVAFKTSSQISQFADQMHETNMRFADSSGAMAGVQARAEVRQIHRDKAAGDYLAESAEELEESRDRAKRAWLPAQSKWTADQNRLSASLNDLNASFGEWISSFYGQKEWDKKMAEGPTGNEKLFGDITGANWTKVYGRPYGWSGSTVDDPYDTGGGGDF